MNGPGIEVTEPDITGAFTKTLFPLKDMDVPFPLRKVPAFLNHHLSVHLSQGGEKEEFMAIADRLSDGRFGQYLGIPLYKPVG